MTQRQIVLYGEVNTNVLDGSATWLVSLAETLTHTDSMIHLVLHAHSRTNRLLTRIADHPQVVLHPPVTRPGYSVMSHAEAVARLEEVVLATGASIAILRGREICAAAASSNVLAEMLWSYVTDFEFPAPLMPVAQLVQLRHIAQRSHRVFAQTEDTRSYLESIAPAASGKCLLMTPTIPDDFFSSLENREHGGPLRLVYSGKLHPDWMTLRSMELPARLLAAGCSSTLTFLGDKFYSPDPTWITRMQSALENPPRNVAWAGGVPREEALSVVAGQDLGLSWRSRDMDGTLEISTKMLEYAASGTPPILNRSPAHEALLGEDYPLFVDETIESVVDVVIRCRNELPQLRAHVQDAVRPYASSASAHRLERHFRRSETASNCHPDAQPSEQDGQGAARNPPWAPHLLDPQDFDRPKHPGASHGIAMMGFVPFSTRPDQALDLLQALLEHDSRFRLHIMGPLPWEVERVWENWNERQSYLAFFERIATTEGLLEHVVFEPQRRDTANWLRSIAWVVVPPGQDCHHPSLAQAKAAGTIPLHLPPDGEASPFGDAIHPPTLQALVERVLAQENDEVGRAKP